MSKYGKLMDRRAVTYMNEQSVELLRFQGVTDAMYNKGYNEGVTVGYLCGILVSVGLLGVFIGSREIGRREEEIKRQNKFKYVMNSIYGRGGGLFKDDRESPADVVEKFKEAMRKIHEKAENEEEEDDEE